MPNLSTALLVDEQQDDCDHVTVSAHLSQTWYANATHVAPSDSVSPLDTLALARPAQVGGVAALATSEIQSHDWNSGTRACQLEESIVVLEHDNQGEQMRHFCNWKLE